MIPLTKIIKCYNILNHMYADVVAHNVVGDTEFRSMCIQRTPLYSLSQFIRYEPCRPEQSVFPEPELNL